MQGRVLGPEDKGALPEQLLGARVGPALTFSHSIPQKLGSESHSWEEVKVDVNPSV